MKVLWISNTIFPDACLELGIKAPVIGGWMQSGANALLEQESDIDLAVVSLYSGKGIKFIDKYRIKYYLVPTGGNDQSYDKQKEKNYAHVFNHFNPDIIHIHGTEYPHSLAAANAYKSNHFVVSIQGLVSSYCNYYYGGIDSETIGKHTTLRDIIRHDTLRCQQKRMKERGDYEISLLKKAIHVIGRTSWDRSSVWAQNPTATYHFCNETLRQPFYEKKWDYDNCNKHSIFLSQANYPIKGGHILLQALPLILRQFPDTVVYIAGHNPIHKKWYSTNAYSAYLRHLIEKLEIQGVLKFVGLLNESQMADYYVKSNVFVCPSSIENSPNSVGEAQLIGTPVVASYVGGTMDMIEDGETGFLYRFEEYPLLAELICKLFSSRTLCETISHKAQKVAHERHNGIKNAKCLISIYHEILEK